MRAIHRPAYAPGDPPGVMPCGDPPPGFTDPAGCWVTDTPPRSPDKIAAHDEVYD